MKIKKIIAKLEKQQRDLDEIMAALREIEGAFEGKDGRPASFDDHERSVIAAALTRAQGNQTEAARMLGIRRDRFRYKLLKHKLLTPNPGSRDSRANRAKSSRRRP
jgi:DNA-binding protein Fis